MLNNYPQLLYFRRSYSLFYDESRSVQFLAEYQKEFLFNEVQESAAAMDNGSDEEDEVTKKDANDSMETTDS